MEQEVQDLRLEIQELRQFCIMLILQLRATSPAFVSMIGIPHDQCDHWWEKLASYPKVERQGI